MVMCMKRSVDLEVNGALLVSLLLLFLYSWTIFQSGGKEDEAYIRDLRY